MSSTHGLTGGPELRDARALETPAGASVRSVAHIQHARAIARLAFGPPADRDFGVRYWDGSLESAGRNRQRFTLVLPHPWSLRAMFWPPAESRIAEAFVAGVFDVEGDIEAAAALARPLRDRLCRPRTLGRLLYHARSLPAPPARRGGRARVAHRPHATPRHSLARDRDAVRSHYDVGNDFYRLWLDERMVYSCAYYASPASTLDDAQRDKLDHICRKLRLRPGERLLDVGCGWGALLLHAAAHYGVRATGITLSPPQAALAESRIRDAGLSDRVHLELRDYRELAPSEPFDKIVSVGMFEHVGRERMAAYFGAMHRMLRPGGLFMNHGIIELPRRRDRGWRAAVRRFVWRPGRFIDRDVFPDGDLVPLALALDAAETAGFETRDVESLRPHYAATLRAWVRRLEARYEEAVQLTNEATARTWRLYMAASAHAFAAAEIGICQVLFGKPDSTGNVQMPLTRTDLYRNA
jgi:cyclopropane-fatty-acyl-phospholipid synthase